MKTLILLAGLPGVGKSHIARILSQELKSYYFDSDKFSKNLFKNINFESLSQEELSLLRINSQKMKIQKIKELFLKHDIIILDTCFDIPDARKIYYRLEKDSKTMIKIIVLEVRCK
jgi:predicted kinase